MADQRPAVLIIGGLGYVGRFLALHVHKNNLASELRIVDKQLPQLARLSPEFDAIHFKDVFLQADASREQFMPKIFDRSNGKQWDFVFNCGGDTRYSQDDDVYRKQSYDLSVVLAKEAARRRVSCFVECSTGQVYDSKGGATPRKETDKIKPWTKLAKWKMSATEAMSNIDRLNLVVLRLANIYGPYANGFISTGLCMARVYQHLGKEMKWLWSAKLMTHTVHVIDAVRALWTAAVWYRDSDQKSGKGVVPVFNIVDHGHTSQGTLAELFHNVFKISTGFQGSLKSKIAELTIEDAVEDVNEETLDAWAELQKKSNVQEGYISPFMEVELLKDTDLSLDGAKFEKETGFQYKKDKMGENEINEMIDSYRRMNWWP